MPHDPYWHFWLVAFGLTVLLEAPFVLTLLRRLEPSWSRRVGLLLLANVATHPLVWFFFPALPFARRTNLLMSEAWAFVAELLIYATWVSNRSSPRALRLRRAALTSLVANAASWALGTALVRCWGHWLF